MSLGWTTYVAPMPPKGAKMQNGRFPCKIALHLKKDCYRVSLCENCRRQSRKGFIGLSICKNDRCGTSPSAWYWLTCSTSAVTPSKTVQLILIGSPLHAFHWAQVEQRTLSLSPQSGSKMQSVQNLNNNLRQLQNGTR